MEKEHDRLAFIKQTQGKEAAIDFARTTYKLYRKALLMSRKRGFTKPHHASTPNFRVGFIQSCIVFRQYIYKKVKQ